MAFVNQFTFAPAPWLPFRDQEVLDRVALEDFHAHQGRNFEHPEFELNVVYEVENYFAIDLFQKIRISDRDDKKLVVILPSPENAVFCSVVEALNKYHVSCRNVEVFFLYEYANENGDVAPWQSPYSRSGHFMRYFYSGWMPGCGCLWNRPLLYRKEYERLFYSAGGCRRRGCCLHCS